jgi:peptidoglycan-associated lipoprotein
MHSRRWLTLVVLGMVCMVAVSGCKKKTKGGPGIGDENIGGVTGSELYGEGLSGRPGEGFSEMAGQFTPVYFDYDSSQINESERAKIETVADHLKKNAAGGVIVEGNCDERGSREYNLALGERRALAVRAYLINLGIDGARIQTKSYGKERPVAMGHDEESWAKNRRGEFVLFQ